jgi:hypothetical protein
MSKRHDPEFEEFFNEHASIDADTGLIKVSEVYAYLGFNIFWKGKPVSMTYANAVWFLTHGKWPRDGYHIDHINDDALDNRPVNLQEITEAENHKKRRGRLVYRNYGTGKYGYGLHIFNDKRDDRFYVTRTMSRGHGAGDLKGIKLSLGGFDTLTEAEARIKELAAQIEANGLNFLPPRQTRNQKKATISLDAAAKQLRSLRQKGHTIQEVADITGLRSGAVYKRIRDLGIDNRCGAAHGGVKLTEEKVHEIRRRVAAGETQIRLAQEFGVSRAMVSQIVKRQAWSHVK